MWQPAHVIHESALEELLDRLSSLRRHQQNGKRAPHKPLLVLLALGRLAETGSSAVPWSVAEKCLGELIAEFGPPSLTARRQSAADPFTRLRSDGVWTLDRDVPMDSLGALDSSPITGRLDPRLEQVLKEPGAIEAAARVIVDSQFPMTVAPDVLLAVGLDTTRVFAAPAPGTREDRRRNSAWPPRSSPRGTISARSAGMTAISGHLPSGWRRRTSAGSTSTVPMTSTTGWRCAPFITNCSTAEPSVWTMNTASSSQIASRRGRSPPGASTNCIIVSCALDGAPSYRLSNTRPGISTRSSRVSP